MDSFTEQFSRYFSREVAERAARSLSDGAQMEIRVIDQETFTFTRQGGKNVIIPGPARSPEIIFEFDAEIARKILDDPTEDIGEIGIHLIKLLTSSQGGAKMNIEAGFLSLFSRGYFGILKVGGSAFASHLASHGLSGMGAIKTALKKLTKD